MNNKETILSRFKDVDKVINMLFPNENIKLYIAGGIGCILIGASVRPTMDFDFIDLGTPAKYLRALNLIGDFDFIDITVTAIAKGFENRAVEVYTGVALTVFAVSAEDLIVMKLNRYNDKDVEDIKKLLKLCNKELLIGLIDNALSDMHNSDSKKAYLKNYERFKEVLKYVY